MKIYISYRRSDSASEAGRLADRVVARFGTDSVFKDVSAIAIGDMRSTVAAEIERCDVVLALIGNNWLDRSRLDNPNDLVRVELEMALSRHIPVVPVLVGGALMPGYRALPDSLRELAKRQAAQLRPDPDYGVDSDRLLRALEDLVGASNRRKTRDEVPDVDPGVSGPITVFVSHSTQDRKWVEREIVTPLSGHGIKPWYSTASISTAS